MNKDGDGGLNMMKLKEFQIDYINTSVMKSFVRKEDLVKKLPILINYENYVISVLNLYCSLCKGRNYKSI